MRDYDWSPESLQIFCTLVICQEVSVKINNISLHLKDCALIDLLRARSWKNIHLLHGELILLKDHSLFWCVLCCFYTCPLTLCTVFLHSVCTHQHMCFIDLHSHREHYRVRQCVCQGIAMLWADHLCESLSLGAIDRPLGPASTQGPICSTECVILSQQACRSSNHSNTHSFLEFWILRPLRTIKTLLFVWFWSGIVSLIHSHWS